VKTKLLFNNCAENPINMNYLHFLMPSLQRLFNIKVELIDESGNRYTPYEIPEIEYLSRFQNKCVVNKVYQKMVADKKSGVIEVYQDKIIVKES
jgi:hypothetical protein